mgnify:CR=1 FL=1
MKHLTVRQLAAVKRNAQNVASLVVKKNKLAEKVADLKNEWDAIVAQIDAYEAGTKAITGGYTSEQLVDRVIEATGKTDASGREIKITKYLPKEGVLVYDEEHKVYTIVEQEEEFLIPTQGDDFDVDAEAKVDEVENNNFDPTQFGNN